MASPDLLNDMNERSREIFRRLVEGYLESGGPVGSRTLTRTLNEKVSAATVRNVMQDLEFLGLLDSPHISAGRVPTQLGLRMFVDGLLEVDQLSKEDQLKLDQTVDRNSQDVSSVLDRVGSTLSALTHGASLVLTPKQEQPIKHIEFVSLSPDRALVVLVYSNGDVENRLFTPPVGQTPSAMREAANFLNAVLEGRTLSELLSTIQDDVGLMTWNASAISQNFLGVRIFIGSENKLFSLTGSSLVVSPYMNSERKIVGAIGVIGPTRLNYGRIVPLVDYTAQLVGKLISDRIER